MSPIQSTTTARPTPPAPTAKALAPDTMALLAQAADTNGDRYLGRDEAVFTRSAGAADQAPYTNHVEASLERGQGFLSGFRLAADKALAIADRFARGDAWVSKEDLDVTDGARRRLDVNGDGRLARHELATGLQNGGLALNAQRLALASEVAGTSVAAPVSRPAPPPVAGTTLGDIRARFDRQVEGAARIFNGSSMTRDQYATAVRGYGNEALRAMIDHTSRAPLAERRALLYRIMDVCSFSAQSRQEYEQRLINDALAANR